MWVHKAAVYALVLVAAWFCVTALLAFKHWWKKRRPISYISGGDGGSYEDIRAWVLQRDGYTCQICGRYPADTTHRVSYRGGTDPGSKPEDELLTVCPRCKRTLRSVSISHIRR